MKVTWITHFVPFPATGHGALQRTHHLIRQLAKVAEVELLAAGPDPVSESSILSMGVQSYQFFQIPQGLSRSVAIGSALLRSAAYWEELFCTTRFEDAVSSRIADGSHRLFLIDIVYLARLVSELHPSRLVVNHHNVESDLLLKRARSASGLKKLFFLEQAKRTRALEADLLKEACLHLVVSSEDAERLSAIGKPRQVAIVPNGVDLEFFTSTPRERRPHSLVFAGGMDWFPNADAMNWVASDLWRHLSAAEPNRSLRVIGKHPPTAIRELAHRDQRVEIMGFVPDVRPFIDTASAYLCPIRIGGGTRLKVLDALAMGCPLVATGLSVDGLGLEDGRHYLRAESADDFVAALRRLDEDPMLRERLVLEGGAHVRQRFGWDVIGRELVTSVEQVFQRSRLVAAGGHLP